MHQKWSLQTIPNAIYIDTIFRHRSDCIHGVGLLSKQYIILLSTLILYNPSLVLCIIYSSGDDSLPSKLEIHLFIFAFLGLNIVGSRRLGAPSIFRLPFIS